MSAAPPGHELPRGPARAVAKAVRYGRSRMLKQLADLDALKASIRQNELDLRVDRPPPEEGEARRRRWILFRKLHALTRHLGDARPEEAVSWRANGEFQMNPEQFRDLVQVVWPHLVFTDQLSPFYFKVAPLFATLDLDARHSADARELPCAMRVLARGADTPVMKHVRFWVETFLDGGPLLSFAELRRLLLTPAQGLPDVAAVDARLRAYFDLDDDMLPRVRRAASNNEEPRPIAVTAADVEELFRATDLAAVLQEQLWAANTHAARQAVLDRRVEESSSEVTASLQKIKRDEILARFQQMGLKDRFSRWVLYWQMARMDNAADDLYFARHCRAALRRLHTLTVFRRDQRAKSRVAERHRMAAVLEAVLERWRALAWTRAAVRREARRRADGVRRRRLLASCWAELRDAALIARHQFIEYSPAAEEHYDMALLRKCFRALLVERPDVPATDEEEAEERQRLLFEFLSGTETEVREAKHIKHEQHAADRLQEEQRAQRERQYEMDMEAKAHRFHDRKKLALQREARRAWKEQAKQEHIAQREQFWADMTKKALADAEREARRWLKTTDGRRALHAEATWLYEEDPESCLIRAKAWEEIDILCRWALTVEGKRSAAQALYIEKTTGRRALAAQLTPEICRDIAEDLIIGARFVEMRQDIAKLRKTEEEQYALDLAARSIQGAWRAKKAFALLHVLGAALYTQTFDEASGRPLYYNVQTHEVRDSKPYVCGSGPVPFETKPWAYRVDFEGRGFYQNRSTGEIVTTMPEGYLRCPRCRVRMATRRCNDCGTRFCLRCHGRLAQSAAHAGHSWTKVPASGLRCLICRTEAEVVCRECREEGYCEGCFEVVHADPRMAEHTNVVSVAAQDEGPLEEVFSSSSDEDSSGDDSGEESELSGLV